MATVDIRLDGVSITDRVLYQRTTFTSMAGGQPGTASVTIDNSDRGITWEDVHAGSTLELYIDGAREWDGWVFGFERSWPFEYDDTTVPADTPIFWTINGYDRNLLFQKRIMFNKSDPSDNRGFKIWPADTPDKTAITYALDNYVELSGDGLSLDIREIDSPSPWEEFTLGFVSAPMGVLFEDCAEMTGGVYWIGPDRKLHYRSDRDVTAPFELSDAPTAGQVGYRELDASLDYTQAATEALVWGAGKGSDDPVFAKYTNTTARDTYGLWQWGDLYVGASEQQTVNRRARTYVNGSPTHRQGHDEPVPVVRCIVFQPGIRAGMVVLFIATMFAYSEALPVRSSTISFPTPDQPRYELEMSLNIDTPFGIPDKWWEEENPYREYVPPEGTGPIMDAPAAASNLIDHFDQSRGPFLRAQVFSSASPTYSDESDIYWTINYPVTLEAGDHVLFAWTGGVSDTQFVYPSGPGDMGQPDGYAYVGGISADPGEYISQTAIYQSVDGGETSVTFRAVDMGYTPFMNFYIAVVRGASSYGEYPTWVDVPGLPFSVFTGYPTSFLDTSITGVPTTPWTYRGKSENGATVLGVATRSIVDEEVSPSSQWTMTNGMGLENIWYFGGGSAATSILKTPGQDITNAPWSGGNPWLRYFDGPQTGAYAQDSSLIVPDYSTEVNDTSYEVVDDPLYDYEYLRLNYWGVEYNWGAWSTSWWSGGQTTDGPDILMKWMIPGDPSEQLINSGSTTAFWIELDLMSIPTGSTSHYDPAVITIYFNIAGRSGHAEYDILQQPTIYRDAVIPYHAYNYPTAGESLPPPLYKGTWYWTRMKVGEPRTATSYAKPSDYRRFFGAPYNLTADLNEATALGYSMSYMKTWRYGEPEPTTSDYEFLWYYYTDEDGSYQHTVPPYEIPDIAEGGWDVMLPAAWNPNAHDISATTEEFSFWEFSNNMSVTTSANKDVMIDGFWAYASTLDQGGGTGTGTIVSDIPVYDNTANTEAGTYITRYPYVPGSLKVWYQGMSLTRNADFLETDPASGMFTITGGRDISSALLVEYLRAGTEPTSGYTGGNVYRPAPVMQYGWGTELDGYNCTAACGCMALDRHTLGQYTQFTGTPRSTPPNMRGFQNDQVGGIDLFDVATAWSNGWGQTLQYVGTTTWSSFVSLINSGRGAILQGMYGNLPASKRFSNSFTGGHAIYINEQFSNGNFYGCDPLYRYPVVYTPAELQAYAVGFISPGLVSAAFTKVT